MADNCTFFPEGTWSECCSFHDKRYSNTRIGKYQADILLFRCVKKRGNTVVASVMFIGVTVFGIYWYIKAQKDTNAYK